MRKTGILAALAMAFTGQSRDALAQFASGIVQYQSGTGFAAGFTNAAAALGEPSRTTPGPFGGPVDPFNPPYLAEQIVSIGAGGSLAVAFNSPILDSPLNPFGIDFVIFGNSGFVITNGDFSGGGITDGSLFSQNPGETRVSVSADGANFYELTPSLAPVVDGLFPTDGAGDFRVPTDPALTKQSFAGRGLADIRQLYAGSAGGSGYDISWARDAQGQPVNPGPVRYVRVEVLSGASEIDGFAVVPEPRAAVLLLLGTLGILAFRERDSRRVP